MIKYKIYISKRKITIKTNAFITHKLYISIEKEVSKNNKRSTFIFMNNESVYNKKNNQIQDVGKYSDKYTFKCYKSDVLTSKYLKKRRKKLI